MRSRHPLICTAVLGALGCVGAQAAEFNQTIFFGDSLTDSGAFKPVLPPGTGKFTTNPGAVWAENLAAFFGTSAAPSTAGGTDFAQGGARVTQLPGVPNSAPTGTATPIATQVSGYLNANRGAANSGALYTVWGGANDIFFQAGLAGAGLATPAQVQANLIAAAGDLATQVSRLAAAGAKTIIVVNVPNIGLTPFGVASGQGATFTALSQLYNQSLAGALHGVNANIVRIDTFSLLNSVIANPSAYGFANATVPACGATVSLVCTSANFVAPNADQNFVFADGVHPTTAAHKLLSDFVISVLNAPQTIGMLAETPVRIREDHLSAIAAQVQFSRADQPKGSFSPFASLDYNPVDYDPSKSSPGGSVDHTGVTVGIDFKITDSILVGGAIGYYEGNVDFDNRLGGYKQKDTAFSLYVGYRQDAFYLSAIATGSDLKYRDVTRNMQLGVVTQTATGNTDGENNSFAIGGGYSFQNGALSHGPFAKLTLQRITVNGYTESGSVAALRFEKQTRESLISSFGYQAAFAAGPTFTPYGKVSVETEYRNKDREVSAGAPGQDSFSLPAFVPDRHYGAATLGVSTKFNKVSGFFEVEGLFGQSAVTSYTVSARVSAAF